MLAYSSIAHAGYLLVALWPGTRLGAGAFLFYLLAYTLMTIGRFGVLAASGASARATVISTTSTGSRPPALARAGPRICMLSLLGFPGTFGFIGKWYILSADRSPRASTSAVILVLDSLVSAGYYLPVIMAMYMKPAGAPRRTGSPVSCGRARHRRACGGHDPALRRVAQPASWRLCRSSAARSRPGDRR